MAPLLFPVTFRGRAVRAGAASALVLALAMSADGGARAQGSAPPPAPAPANPDQNAALQVVARMTEGQRTYVQKNGSFRATVSDIQRDFGISLPATFNYAVRTTTEAAYSYVIPASSTKGGSLKAYVGAAFLTPNQNPRVTTIICQNLQPGPIRPPDPQLVLGTLVGNPNGRVAQCVDASVQVKASVVTE